MENNPSQEEEVSTATAVLLGALAPGVNGQTWSTLKIAFLMLGLCLAAMLALAFSASDSAMIIHVTLLVLITGTLFFLLTSFLAQTGLVTVENQMKEMGLAPKTDADKSQ
ncbi:putative Transmembrane protein [Heracleum sosnowskyi]|uniref:Transmembrane protein n=1 Tax=Heracleum sosnowskyi TaxID=360622 RepID=A0AAD8HYT7_9APIA|nr:putative Transmembrane protein [Heracleum sosnowskyi]